MEISSWLLSLLIAQAIPVTLPPELLYKLIFPFQALSVRRHAAYRSTTCHYVPPYHSLSSWQFSLKQPQKQTATQNLLRGNSVKHTNRKWTQKELLLFHLDGAEHNSQCHRTWWAAPVRLRYRTNWRPRVWIPLRARKCVSCSLSLCSVNYTPGNERVIAKCKLKTTHREVILISAVSSLSGSRSKY